MAVPIVASMLLRDKAKKVSQNAQQAVTTFRPNKIFTVLIIVLLVYYFGGRIVTNVQEWIKKKELEKSRKEFEQQETENPNALASDYLVAFNLAKDPEDREENDTGRSFWTGKFLGYNWNVIILSLAPRTKGILKQVSDAYQKLDPDGLTLLSRARARLKPKDHSIFSTTVNRV